MTIHQKATPPCPTSAHGHFDIPTDYEPNKTEEECFSTAKTLKQQVDIIPDKMTRCTKTTLQRRYSTGEHKSAAFHFPDKKPHCQKPPKKPSPNVTATQQKWT